MQQRVVLEVGIGIAQQEIEHYQIPQLELVLDRIRGLPPGIPHLSLSVRPDTLFPVRPEFEYSCPRPRGASLQLFFGYSPPAEVRRKSSALVLRRKARPAGADRNRDAIGIMDVICGITEAGVISASADNRTHMAL